MQSDLTKQQLLLAADHACICYIVQKGVEHSMGKGGPKLYRSQGNSEYLFLNYSRHLFGQHDSHSCIAMMIPA